MKIAIFNKDIEEVKIIEHNIKSVVDELSNNTECDIYYNGEILPDTDIAYDIAFLEIANFQYDGIELAKKLKSVNNNIILFFVASDDKYLDEAMDIKSFRYMVRPIDICRLRAGIEKAVDMVNNSEKIFLVQSGKDVVLITSDEIVFVEIYGHYTKIQTEDQCYLSGNNIDFWEKKLNRSSFYRVHKSYIVNMKYISGYSREKICLCNNYSVPISYRKQSTVKSVLTEYLAGK